MRYVLLFLGLSGLFGACIEDQEGCLDLAATNFDVGADIECVEPCCEYPTLRLQVQHRVVSAELPDSLQRFRYDSVYLLGSPPDSIRFDYFRFYLHDVALDFADGGTAQVAERLPIFSPTAGELTVVDDVMRVAVDEFGLQALGEIRPAGTLTGLRLRVGLPEEWGRVAPGDYPAGHPLRVGQAEPTYDTLAGYSSLAAAFRVPPGAPDSTVVRFLGDSPVSLPLDVPLELRRGFDLVITLRLNYHRLFADLNLAQATNGTLTGALIDRLPNSIELVDVSQD